MKINVTPAQLEAIKRLTDDWVIPPKNQCMNK